MVSRKSHPKSRNGCANCKKRRIKCDEVKPRCSNCEKHSISCDFSGLSKSTSISSSSPTTIRHQNSDPKSLVPKQESSTDQSPPSQPSFLKGPGVGLPSLQMDDLTLLHHFVTETCYTLSDRPQSHALWRVKAPQVAFDHDFLMRGILAIAALHLGWLQPGKQGYWSHVAVRQQDVALSSFREIMSQGKMDESNCDAFFALSSLIVVYGFESPKASDSLGMFNYNGQDSDEWLPLIRGVNTVLQSVWPWIKNGRLSGLLHDHQQEPPQTELPAVLNQQLSGLRSLCEKSSDEQEAIEAYKSAVDSLELCFVRMNNRPAYECEISIAFLWPVMIPQEFISSLYQRRPEALIILAHYCVILHGLDGYWWMNGWAMHIIGNIYRELDEEWRCWIEWPSEVIRVGHELTNNKLLHNESAMGDDSGTSMDQPPGISSKELQVS